MAKGKNAGGGKAPADDAKQKQQKGGGGLKPATAINVRHILVCDLGDFS